MSPRISKISFFFVLCQHVTTIISALHLGVSVPTSSVSGLKGKVLEDEKPILVTHNPHDFAADAFEADEDIFEPDDADEQKLWHDLVKRLPNEEFYPLPRMESGLAGSEGLGDEGLGDEESESVVRSLEKSGSAGQAVKSEVPAGRGKTLSKFSECVPRKKSKTNHKRTNHKRTNHKKPTTKINSK